MASSDAQVKLELAVQSFCVCYGFYVLAIKVLKAFPELLNVKIKMLKVPY